MKTIIPTVFLLIYYTLAHAQTNSLTGPYKYFIGKENPDAGWHQREFNDASWSESAEGIGGIF